MRASTWLLVTCAAWCAITAVGEGVGLRDESDVEKMREEVQAAGWRKEGSMMIINPKFVQYMLIT